MEKIIVWFLCVILVIGMMPMTTNACKCQSNSDNPFTAEPLLVSQSDRARVENAMAWLKSMAEPFKNSGDGSTITSDEVYDYDYTGPISGGFTLANTRETIATPLTVTAPSQFPDRYRGTVTGTSTVAGPGIYVRAYLYTDSEYDQSYFAPPAEVDENGNWSIDLSEVDPDWAGTWRFKLFDGIEESASQVGITWPQQGFPAYRGLEIRSYALTDSYYLLSSQPATTSHRWSFPSTDPGEKVIRLVDTENENEILAEYFEPEYTGLIRSYEYLPGQDGYGTGRVWNTYIYDQALALLVAVGANDKDFADDLLNGLYLVQWKEEGPFFGGFTSGVEQLDPYDDTPSMYTGGNAFVAYALIRYYEKYGEYDGENEDIDILEMIDNIFTWISTQKTTEGLASGLYKGGNSLNDDGQFNQIQWHSTEHNTDLWHALERAGRVLNNDEYLAEAESLRDAILSKLWNYEENRFNQGFQDDDIALDPNTWGSVFLSAVGENIKATQALAFAEQMKIDRGDIKGYTPYIRDDSVPTVWFEGTFGAVLAYASAGELTQAYQVLSDAFAGQDDNGAFPYALDADLPNGRTDANSVASTAWFVLSGRYPDVMWSEIMSEDSDCGDGQQHWDENENNNKNKNKDNNNNRNKNKNNNNNKNKNKNNNKNKNKNNNKNKNKH